MAVPVTAVLSALIALLMVALASRISQLRVRHKISLGDGGHPEVLRAVRAHGNTAEHAPIFILLVLAYELTAGPTVLLIACAATFVLARLVYTAGLLGRGLHLLRMAGAAATYLLQALVALGLLAAVAMA